MRAAPHPSLRAHVREYIEGHLRGFGTYDMAAAAGEPNIFVGLYYRDSRAALAWLERALGFRKTFEVPGPDGTLMHAEMRLGDGAIMLDSGPRSAWADDDQAVHVYLADPDAHYARAKDAGATIIRPPHDMRWARAVITRRTLTGSSGGSAPTSPQHESGLGFTALRGARP